MIWLLAIRSLAKVRHAKSLSQKRRFFGFGRVAVAKGNLADGGLGLGRNG